MSKKDKYGLIAIVLVVVNLFLIQIFLNEIASSAVTVPRIVSDSVKVSWDRNTESDMKSYQIYQVNAEKTLLQVVNHPDTTTAIKTVLSTYYTVVSVKMTAKDITGNESALSESAAIICCKEKILFGDLNKDNRVDGLDRATLIRAGGSVLGDAVFDESKDLDGNGRVDGEDRALILPKLGNMR